MYSLLNPHLLAGTMAIVALEVGGVVALGVVTGPHLVSGKCRC